MMDISKYFPPESCTIELAGKTKEEIIRSLAGLIEKSPNAADVDLESIEHGLLERETLGSSDIDEIIAGREKPGQEEIDAKTSK